MSKTAGKILKFLPQQKTIWGLFITQFACSFTPLFFPDPFIVYPRKGLHLYFQSRDRRHAAPYFHGDAFALLWRHTLLNMLLKRKIPNAGTKITRYGWPVRYHDYWPVTFFENQPVIAIVILSVAFFCQRLFKTSLVWSDVIPRNFSALWVAFLNICKTFSGIVSPIVIGVISSTQNFQYAMWYIAGVADQSFY